LKEGGPAWQGPVSEGKNSATRPVKAREGDYWVEGEKKSLGGAVYIEAGRKKGSCCGLGSED